MRWAITSLTMMPTASLLFSCSQNKIKYKLEVLKHFFKTKNDDYYVCYQFDDLSIDDKTKLEKVFFSTSIINDLNQRVGFNVNLKPII